MPWWVLALVPHGPPLGQGRWPHHLSCPYLRQQGEVKRGCVVSIAFGHEPPRQLEGVGPGEQRHKHRLLGRVVEDLPGCATTPCMGTHRQAQHGLTPVPPSSHPERGEASELYPTPTTAHRPACLPTWCSLLLRPCASTLLLASSWEMKPWVLTALGDRRPTPWTPLSMTLGGGEREESQAINGRGTAVAVGAAGLPLPTCIVWQP